MHRARPRRVAAFTLVELLVVIGIIALLISILLPTLGAARRAATSLQCASNMRSILQGMQLYAAGYNNAIVGSPWTSGGFIRGSAADAQTYTLGAKLTAYDGTNCYGIVTSNDFVSPIAKMLKTPPFNEGGTAADRKDRFGKLNGSGVFKCPENDLLMDEFAGAAPLGFGTTFLPMTSYSTSLDFLLLRTRPGWTFYGAYHGRPNTFEPPAGYVPKLNKVGNASRKVYLSEGARFVQADGTGKITRIDFDAAIASSNGGIYSDQRAWCGNPTSFNRSRLLFPPYDGNPATSAGQQQQSSKCLLVFARHGSRKLGDSLSAYRMNLGFFDGHVESLPVMEAMNPEFWSPRGMELLIDGSQCYRSVKDKYFPGSAASFTWICP